MRNTFYLIIPFFLLLGCSQKEIKVDGLWELKEVNVDGLIKNFKPTYLQFTDNKIFSVSRINGDLTGIYTINDLSLKLESTDKNWFNTPWKILLLENKIILTGLEYGYRTTKLSFTKIEQFPTFEDFETMLIGDWKLYKTVKDGKVQQTKNTFFQIKSNSSYSILKDSIEIEKSEIIIDSRHQKITFIENETKWNAWFFGEELRLDNAKLKISYRLKKIENK